MAAAGELEPFAEVRACPDELADVSSLMTANGAERLGSSVAARGVVGLVE